MKRQGRRNRQTLKALTDPQPEFVSLVFGGANKTPFRALRADGSAVAEEEMPETVAKSIARVEFSGAKFTSEAAVKSWLTNGGYDPAMPITKTEAGFMVDSVNDPATVLTCIDLYDTQGIKLYTVAVADKTPTLELTEKMELHPGALIDLTMGMYEDVRKSIKEGHSVHDAVQQFMARVEQLVATLPAQGDDIFHTAFDAAAPEIEVEKIEDERSEKIGARNNSNDRKRIQAMHDASVDMGADCASKKEDVMSEQKTDEKVEAAETVEKTDEVETTAAVETAEEKTEEVEAETTEKTVETAEVEEEKTEEVAAEEVAAEKSDEVESEKSDKTDPVATLMALVTELTTTVKSMGSNLNDEIAKVVERVAAVEETRQTRKGADVDETSTASATEKDVSKDIADIRTRSVLGMRRPLR